MAVIKDVLTLGYAINLWSDRTDIESLLLLEFIDFAGRRACQDLRVPAMEKEVLLRAESGRLAIPGTFLQLRNLTGPDANTVKALEYVPWDFFVQESNNSETGPPAIFSRQGGSWYVYPTPTDGDTFLCSYYSTFEPLSPTNTSNWLLELSPMAYLFGALQYLCEYTMDNERAAYWEQKFSRELLRIQAMSDSAEHRGSTLATRVIK